MERRTFLTSLVVVPALGLLAACGSDSSRDALESSGTEVDSPAGTVPSTSADTTTEPPGSDVPTVALSDEPLLSYTTPGGFTTQEIAFQDPPHVLVTAGGTLIGPAVTPAIFPGPLLPQHQVQEVSPAGIEALLAAADAAGLLADVEYPSDDALLVADAATARLTVSVGGTTYTHEAYALGVGGGPGGGSTESTPERQALLDFLTALQADPASIIGAEYLGAPSDYQPAAVQLTAMPIEDLSGFEPAPTVRPWPAGSGIELATATDCVEVGADGIGDLLQASTQLTFFSEDGVIYQVLARPAYPGRSC